MTSGTDAGPLDVLPLLDLDGFARAAKAIVDRERPGKVCDVVGHDCDSGDLLVPGITLATPGVDDLLVVAAKGAYGSSLMNNYDGACRPPVVLVRDGEARWLAARKCATSWPATCSRPRVEDRPPSGCGRSRAASA
jgi:hypothetical protein